MGIIGILAGIGIPLYQAQSTKATNAVIKSNLRSVGGIIDTTKALQQTLYLTDLAGNLKVKGKILTIQCFSGNNGGATMVAGSTGIAHNATAWCIRIADDTGCNLGVNTSTPLDTTLDGCTDHLGKYFKGACVCSNAGATGATTTDITNL